MVVDAFEKSILFVTVPAWVVPVGPWPVPVRGEWVVASRVLLGVVGVCTGRERKREIAIVLVLVLGWRGEKEIVNVNHSYWKYQYNLSSKPSNDKELEAP